MLLITTGIFILLLIEKVNLCCAIAISVLAMTTLILLGILVWNRNILFPKKERA
jgi:hypothetical protein